MKITSHTHDMYTVPGTDLEVELPIKPSGAMTYLEPLISISLTAGEITIGYLADDSDAENPLENDDYAGKIFEARRHGPTLRDYEQALGLGDFEGEPRNPYAVMLDVYEHGQVSYSLSGQGVQCNFDTARSGAVWVPGELNIEQIKKALDPMAEARKMAAADARMYTDWRNGNCFGVVVVTYDREGNEIDMDSCWGFIGDDYAYEALKSDYFPAEVPA